MKFKTGKHYRLEGNVFSRDHVEGAAECVLANDTRVVFNYLSCDCGISTDDVGRLEKRGLLRRRIGFPDDISVSVSIEGKGRGGKKR